MNILQGIQRRPAESSLHREAVHDTQIPHDYTSRALFALLYLELAGLVGEVVLSIATHDYWKYVLVEAALWRVVVVAAVDENIVLATVPVKVTVHDDFSLVQ